MPLESAMQMNLSQERDKIMRLWISQSLDSQDDLFEMTIFFFLVIWMSGPSAFSGYIISLCVHTYIKL